MKNERKRVTTRLVAGLLAVLVAGAGLALTSGTAAATQSVAQSTRVSGVDVYATSASAAISSHTGAATASVLVSGDSYADGLSAAALAGAVGGPVILTDPDTLKGSTSLAIGQINSTTAAGHTVYIVGGTAAVSAGVATSISDLGYVVSRVSGADRVATADAVATKIRTLQDFGTNWDSDTTVFLTTARNFADAVAVSGLAWKNVSPILLVEPADGLSAGTTAILDSAVNSIEHVIILGGTAAVSADVETAVKAIKNGAAGTTAIEVTRVGGDDRYDTAKKLMELRTKAETLNGYGETATTVILVNGTSHQDGLSAAALAGASATMTLLTDGTGTLNATTSAALTAKGSTITTVRAIGMIADLSAAEMTAADAAATTTTNTCTITANEADTVMSVTFSAAVLGAEGDQDGSTNADGTGAGLESNYKLNNSALAANSNATAGSAGAGDVDQPNLTEVLGSTAAATASSITFGTAFTVGDVLSVPGTTLQDTGANYIATCSKTVANDATRPTVTVDKFPIGGLKGILHFSEKVTSFSGNASDSLSSNKSTGGLSTYVATQVGSTNYYQFERTDGGVMVSGEIVTVDASEFTDLGALSMAADATKTAVTDTTAPTATATIASTSYTRALSSTLGTTGTFTIGAVAGGIGEGVIGNLWTFEAIEGTAGAVPVVSLYDTVNRKMVLAADFTSPTTASTPTADNICATVNDHADISGNFKCLVVAGGTSSAVVASSALNGGTAGTATHSINVVFSEMMQAGFDTITYYTVDADADTVYTDDGTESVRTAACTTANDAALCAYSTGANSYIGGTMQFKYAATSAANNVTAGSSVLGISTSVKDFKGNAIGSSVVRVTIN